MAVVKSCVPELPKRLVVEGQQFECENGDCYW